MKDIYLINLTWFSQMVLQAWPVDRTPSPDIRTNWPGDNQLSTSSAPRLSVTPGHYQTHQAL